METLYVVALFEICLPFLIMLVVLVSVLVLALCQCCAEVAAVAARCPTGTIGCSRGARCLLIEHGVSQLLRRHRSSEILDLQWPLALERVRLFSIRLGHPKMAPLTFWYSFCICSNR